MIAIFNKEKRLSLLKDFYNNHQEVILYLFFGGLTFCISITSYSLLCVVFRWNELISNIFSWIAAVSFAYITNRIWVFKTNAQSFHEIISEISSFVGGRIATLIIEELILFIFIILLKFDKIAVKMVAQVVVIALNYIISKILVFKIK